MALMESVKNRAKANVKHIVLPEGNEPRVLKAAAIICAEGIARVTILGKEAAVRELAPSAAPI